MSDLPEFLSGHTSTPRGRPKRNAERADINTWAGYDRFNVYPRSQDHHGNRESMTLWLPRDVHDRIMYFVSLHPALKYPGDWMRSEAIHGLKWWSENYEDIPAQKEVARMLEHEERVQTRMREEIWEKQIDETSKYLAKTVSLGNWESLREELRGLNSWKIGKPGYLQDEVDGLLATYERKLPK